MTFTSFRQGGDIPDHQIELDDVRYWSDDVKEMRYELGSMVIVFKGHEFVNKCDKCHRFDRRPRVARSWEDAIAKGWVTRVCDYEDISTHADVRAGAYFARFECGAEQSMGRFPLTVRGAR